MSLISIEQMSVLKPATELAAVVKTAAKDQQLMKIAYALNTAANSGEHSITFSGEAMLDEVKKELVSKGYTIIDDSANGRIGYHYHISYHVSKENK